MASGVVCDRFLKGYLPSHFEQYLEDQTQFCPDLRKVVIDYLTYDERPFGAAQWKQYFGVDVGEEPSLPDAFYQFWQGPDPIDKTKKVWETHYPPVLGPRYFGACPSIDSFPSDLHRRTLHVLKKLANNPKEGPAARFCGKDELGEHEWTAAEPSWIVLRKELIKAELDKPYHWLLLPEEMIRRLNRETGIGYEEAISIVDLVTVIFTRYVSTGERLFSSGSRLCYCECKETVEVSDVDDHELFDAPLTVGNFQEWGGLFILAGVSSDRQGVALLKRFPIERPNLNIFPK